MRTYRVSIDNDTTTGIEVCLSADVSDLSTIDALEATVAEVTRRLLAAARDDVLPWDTREITSPVRS